MEKILFTSNEVEVECNPEDLNRECIIYRFTFPNKKQYIGQTWRPLEVRIKNHINDAYNKNHSGYDSKKSRAIRKYGKFKTDILYQGFILNEQEKFFINYFDTIEKGYNICKGGDGSLGFHHSDKAKRKIGANNPDRKAIFMCDKNTHEIIRRFEAIVEAIQYLFGVNLTRQEIRSKTSNIIRCLQKPTSAAFGYKWVQADENVKKKLFEMNLGVNNPRCKAIFMCDENTQKIIRRFEAIADAARYLFGKNLTPKELNKITVNIAYYLKHSTRAKYGYTWKYVDENPW